MKNYLLVIKKTWENGEYEHDLTFTVVATCGDDARRLANSIIEKLVWLRCPEEKFYLTNVIDLEESPGSLNS